MAAAAALQDLEGVCPRVSFHVPRSRFVGRAFAFNRAVNVPNRPALTGAICGLGVGIMADAGVRLFCWVTEPAHVLIAHGGAIVLLMALGAACATLVERVRARRP